MSAQTPGSAPYGRSALDEEYQLHAYPRGAPVTMTRITTPDNQQTNAALDYNYDLADTEFRSWYKTNANKSGGSLADLEGYRPKEIYSADGALVTIFRAPASATPSSGTVSVTDRFGNTYSRTVSW